MSKKMLIKREIEAQVCDAAREYPVIAIIGPRYAGKTTLVQMTFPDHKYVSLEDFDIRELVLADLRRFLTEYPSSSGIILDEIQNWPQATVLGWKSAGYLIKKIENR